MIPSKTKKSFGKHSYNFNNQELKLNPVDNNMY